MTDTTADLRALANRPIPTVAVADPWRTEPDAAQTAAQDRVAEASRQSAALDCGVAADIIASLVPNAHRVVFSLVDDDDRGYSAQLLTVRDAAGALLWHDEYFDYHPDAAARDEVEAYGGPVMPKLDSETREAIEAMLEVAAEASYHWFDWVHVLQHDTSVLTCAYHPDGCDPTVGVPAEFDLWSLVVPDAISRAAKLRAETPGDTISFDTLAEVLRTETGIVDSDDVDSLMDAIRAAAGAPSVEREGAAAPVAEAETPPIRKVLDLATAHLPEEYGSAGLSGVDGVIAYDLAYGWLMWVPNDPAESSAATDEPVPTEILAIQEYARKHGCDYVLFDADADRIDALPSWDW